MESKMHVGDDAELYAAGALTEQERADVEAHAANCPECLRRIGEAEETVLALERDLVARVPQPVSPKVSTRIIRPAAWWTIPAIAAALLVGFLLPRPPAQTDPAPLAMLHSHFSHAQFGGASGVPAAKVLYARDRSWYYVIVEGAHRYDVFGERNGNFTALGQIRPVRGTSEVFVRPHARFDRLELRDGGAVIEAASIR